MSTAQSPTARTVGLTRRRFMQGLLAVPALALGGGLLNRSASAQSASFAIGDHTMVNTDILNLRQGPGLDYGIQDSLAYGTYLSIQDGPVSADGYTWYQVYSDPDGWVAGEFLIRTGLFPIGTAIVVTTDWLNLRDGFGLDAPVIDVLPYGTTATVNGYPADGPLDGYTWYLIDTDDGRTGWVAADFVSPAGEPGGDPGGNPGGGATATVNTDALNIRANVGLGADIIGVLAWGTPVTITGGPINTDGYSWYEVITDGPSGWVAGEFLAFDGDTGGGPGGGSMAMVDTDALNFRSNYGLAAGVIDVLSAGALVTISSGPIAADGYNWYEVIYNDQYGWVAGEFLVPAYADR